MMTRGATVRDLNEKLNAALKELEVSRKTCKDLLRERDENEVEVKEIIDKNTELKRQLVELHTQHVDILDQHNHLRQLVSEFQECRDTHDQALNRISGLEAELSVAHSTLSTINSLRVREQVANTNNLFDKLVGSASEQECKNTTVTIDLTGDDTLTKCQILSSHNRIKKYIKINKNIKKYKKLLKSQNIYKYNINLRKQRSNLHKQLVECNCNLEKSKLMYDNDIENLQKELLSRENTIKDIFCKYESCQQMLSERMQEACELVDLVKFNAERYESLTNNLTCSCAPTPSPPMSQSEVPASLNSVPHTSQTINSCESNILVYSDRIGSGFGSLLNNRCKHTIVSHCYHNLHFNELVYKIKNTQMNEQTTVVLMIGNSFNITKRDIVNGIETLLKLKLCKLILCALPYSNSLLDHENEYIFTLNNTMHILSCRHSDRLLYFDTNNFVRDFVLIREHMFLPKNSRHVLATLLAYNIHAVINNLTEIRLRDESVLSSIPNNTDNNSLNS
ncbi:hypothetical protein PYW07_014158 [Mythimna separata]|uniref:Uncharacterized protein n=1 Tax=Mythimna separata TaxID=271217 RepID=A0AAD7YXU1_MYTSE|nr:hypothetical protein PYW07_014158 [Mythimna separata]